MAFTQAVLAIFICFENEHFQDEEFHKQMIL